MKKNHAQSPLSTSIQLESSSKVEELYAKFENLKQRISNTDSKRSSRSNDRKSIVDVRQREIKYRRIGFVEPLPLSVYVGMRNQNKKEEEKRVSSFQTHRDKGLAEQMFVDGLVGLIRGVEQRYSRGMLLLVEKLGVLQTKLGLAQQLIRQRRVQQQQHKVNSSFSDNPNNTTRCHTLKSLSENTIQFVVGKQTPQIQEKHKYQTNAIIKSYQQKLYKLIGSGVDGEERMLAGEKERPHIHRLGVDKWEDVIIAKDKEIYELQVDNKRLKKMLEQSKLNFQRNSELNKLLKDENKILEEKLEKLQFLKKQFENERKVVEGQVQKLRSQVGTKSGQIKKLKEDICKLQQRIQSMKGHHNVSNYQQLKSSKNRELSSEDLSPFDNQQSHLKQRRFELQSVDTDRSEVIDDLHQRQVGVWDLQIQRAQLEKIRRSQSQVFNRQSLFNVANGRREKELLAQIYLLEEENRLLKYKKDKFQAEVFKAQNDEDMMQQQLMRLNQEIRRLNGLWYNLDECAVKLLRGEQLKEEKVLMLQKEAKLREEYYKLKEKKQTKKRGFSLRR